MGDKSPKSKQRNQKQKDSARTESQAKARSKQDGYSHIQLVVGKGKK
jgi:hypothetical protein